MSRYFFEIEVADRISDATGLDLSDREAARAHAIHMATKYLQEADLGPEARSVRTTIKDEAGDVLDTVNSVSMAT